MTERQASKLLANNAEKLVDPDLRRKYKLDLVTSGGNVYDVKRETVEVKQNSILWSNLRKCFRVIISSSKKCMEIYQCHHMTRIIQD